MSRERCRPNYRPRLETAVEPARARSQPLFSKKHLLGVGRQRDENLRFGLRMLLKSPLFSLMAATAFALGVEVRLCSGSEQGSILRLSGIVCWGIIPACFPWVSWWVKSGRNGTG